METLPNEILEMILDLSYDNKEYDFADLYRLSIVSKRWNNIIKKMSFRIIMHSLHSYEYLQDIFTKIKIQSIEIYIYEEMEQRSFDYINENLKNIKDITLGFNYDLDYDTIKNSLYSITNIVHLYFCMLNIFEDDEYDNNFFPPMKKLKYLNLSETVICNNELKDLFIKFPNLVSLNIENCEILDNKLFHIAHEYLKKLTSLFLTVEEIPGLCFSDKDIEYIKKNYPNIKNLYVNGELI